MFPLRWPLARSGPLGLAKGLAKKAKCENRTRILFGFDPISSPAHWRSRPGRSRKPTAAVPRWLLKRPPQLWPSSPWHQISRSLLVTAGVNPERHGRSPPLLICRSRLHPRLDWKKLRFAGLGRPDYHPGPCSSQSSTRYCAPSFNSSPAPTSTPKMSRSLFIDISCGLSVARSPALSCGNGTGTRQSGDVRGPARICIHSDSSENPNDACNRASSFRKKGAPNFPVSRGRRSAHVADTVWDRRSMRFTQSWRLRG
jgi:hypothetical protein